MWDYRDESQDEKNGSDDMERRNAATPAIPLPNPGEGGPVFPGTNGNDGENNRPEINLPEINLPGGNRPGGNRPGGNRPGGARPQEDDNSLIGGLITTIITSLPRPNIPCKFCPNNNVSTGVIRCLNATSGYNPFSVYVNANMLLSSLGEGEVSAYERVPAGTHTISIVGNNGYVYVQKQIMVPVGKVYTLAIINTTSGLDFMVIEDMECARTFGNGCIRICNLATNSGSINVSFRPRSISFENVAFRELTDFKSIWPGDYTYYISRNSSTLRPIGMQESLLSSTLKIDMNVSYTMYVSQWNISSPDAIRAIIVEER